MDDLDDEFDMDIDMTDVLAAMEQVESRAQTPTNNQISNSKHVQAINITSTNNNRDNNVDRRSIATIDNDGDYEFEDDFEDLDVDALVNAADAVEKQNTTNGKHQPQTSLSAYYGTSSSTNAPQNVPSSLSRSTELNNSSNWNTTTDATARSSNSRITFGLPEDIEDPIPPPPPPADAKTFHPFDSTSLPTWIYPTNHPIRGYQFNIVRKALFSNTLVSIPTGLGKTFIAAVVMYNYYRWFPNSIMIFMAPTRPLVEQQIKACHDVCGIPQKDTVMMVGTSGKVKRPQLWATGRIFFCTPQVVDNDLANGICPAHKVVLLVIDEAHKATGNFAYTNVIERLGRIHSHFRVLALSATPGSTVDKVQTVVNNLRINNIEVRTEESMDVQEFSFGKRVQNIVIKLNYTTGATGIVPRIAQSFCQQVFQPVLDRLAKRKAIYGPTVERCTPYILLNDRKNYQLNAKNVPPAVKRIVTVDFLLAETMARAYEGLCVYGVGTFVDTLDRFLQSIRNDIEAGKNVPSENYKLLNHFGLKQLLDQTRQQMGTTGFVGHPKLDSLLNIILRHFNDQQQTNDNLNTASSSSRIMVFSSLRASVNMIVDFLSIHHPLIKCAAFVGQAGDAQGGKGMSQKEQQEAIERFKKGDINVMVATSIGEEGLDIGEVDLIVCYDSQSSSIRLLQRMGRTGRRRKGHCVMLMTEQEERKFKRATESYKYIQNMIAKRNVIECCNENPSLLPPSYQPVVQRKRLVIGNYLTTMVQGMKRRRQGDNTAYFQKDGTLNDQGMEALLETLPHGVGSSLDQAYDRLWPSFHPLKGALKYLSLQQNQTPTSRVGHSCRTVQFTSLMRKMEDRILKGPNTDQDSSMQSSQKSSTSGNHVLNLPKRRKPTENLTIGNVNSTHDDADDDSKNSSNNSKLILPISRSSRATSTKHTSTNGLDQDPDIVENVVNVADEIGWASFMEPIMAKGMADDEYSNHQGYKSDNSQGHQDDYEFSMDHKSPKEEETNTITLASHSNAGGDDELPTKVPDEKTQPSVLSEIDFDDDDFGDMNMDFWDNLQTQEMQVRQLQNIQKSTKSCPGFLFDDDLQPLLREGEQQSDFTLAHSSTNFTTSFVWATSRPIFSNQAKQILIQRLQNCGNHYLSVRLLADQHLPGTSTNHIITANSPLPLALPPTSKSPDSYEFDDINDSDLAKLRDSMDLPIETTEAPTRTHLQYKNPPASEQRVMVNDNYNNNNGTAFIDTSTDNNIVDLDLGNNVDDASSMEWSITDSQPNLYELKGPMVPPARPNNVNTKMATESEGCLNDLQKSDDTPNEKSPSSSLKVVGEVDHDADGKSASSWEVHDSELDDTSNAAASITTPLGNDKIRVDSHIPIITTPPTALEMPSKPLMHSTPQDKQLQQRLGEGDFENRSQYLYSPTVASNNQSPLRFSKAPNENDTSANILDDNSHDSSIIRRRRSRRAPIIRDSEDDLSLNSPHQDRVNLNINKTNDRLPSPMKKEYPAESTVISSDGEENDDQRHKSTTQRQSQRHQSRHHQRSRQWLTNPFLDDEAEQSDDGIGSDDEEEMVDASSVMDSFIYDGSSELVPEGKDDDGDCNLLMTAQEKDVDDGGHGTRRNGIDDMAMYRTSLLQQDVATTHGASSVFASDFRRKTWLDKMEMKKWEYIANDDEDDEVYHDASDVYSDAVLDAPGDDGVSENISRFTNASDDFM